MGIASFELLHINCMAMSRNIRRLEKKLYRKLLKTQIDIETLLQEVSNLSTDREWADNAAIQVTSNAFRISIEILNNSEKIPSYTILPFDEDSVASPQHVVVGYIGNVHYVSTEFHDPFPPAMWGGSIAGSSREFVNTCPVDGPLTWLVYSMVLAKGFSHYILEKLPIALRIFESFQAGNSVKGKMLWYESQLKKTLIRQEPIY